MSEFSRETLLNIIETDHVLCGEASALARLVLAGMNSEPDCKERKLFCSTDTARMRKVISVSAGTEDAPLYRHAQQAPASEPVYQYWCYTTVENSEGDPEEFWFWKDCEKDFYDRWENAKRTLYKTPQPAPVVPENCVTAEHRRVIEMLLNVCGAAFELADDSCQQDVDGEDCHVVPDDAFRKLSDALDEIENTLPTEDIDRPDVFLAWSAMPRAALKSLLQGGNSPVIPDSSVIGWLRYDYQESIKKVGGPLFILGANDPSDAWGLKYMPVAKAGEQQSAPQNIPEIIPGWIPVSEQKPDCWCLTCRPVVLNDMRFVVCPDCGNKRCPRANDHRNACTGSNEPGQEGNAYPDTPREVKP